MNIPATRPAGMRVASIARRLANRRAGAALIVPPVLFLAFAAWHRRWVTDDAFIDFRVVANLHHGFGPVWNVGERVEAYTSPLWVAILWLASGVLRFVALEWIAVVLGLMASVVGAYVAARGSVLLWRGARREGLALPLGLITLVAVPPVWDFSTSGLETGLTFLWLGTCFWLVARQAVGTERSFWLSGVTAGAIGLGPLVRPDLGIFTLGFLVALLLARSGDTRLRKLTLILWALLLPLAYQVFRMGYFASLEPNTALAKEAGATDWSRGWRYLTDFIDPYLLVVPLAILFAYTGIELRGTWRAIARPIKVAACAPVVCGLVHAVYIVRLGGDFMHARMLLPSLFGVLLPITVIVPRHRRWSAFILLAVLVWAVICAAALRGPYAKAFMNGVFEDEHAAYVHLAAKAHPITLSDYAKSDWGKAGLELRRLAKRGAALALVPSFPVRLDKRRWPGRASVIAAGQAIGILGYAAGPRVHIVDQFGLADPLASRFRLGPLKEPVGLVRRPHGEWTVHYQTVRARRRPGHEKYMPMAWIVARYAPSLRLNAVTAAFVPAVQVAAARQALNCTPLRQVLTAVDTPLTFGRFLSNLGASFSLTSLRFPSDPVAAEHTLCH